MITALPKSWRNIKLSPHFKLGEFYISSSYPDLAKEMNPNREQVDSLIVLSQLGLEPIRRQYGPVRVTSGARSTLLNQAVGGAGASNKSQHLRGKACDFICPNVRDMVVVYHYICQDMGWPGEVFYYKDRGHIHIGLPEYGVTPDRKIV